MFNNILVNRNNIWTVPPKLNETNAWIVIIGIRKRYTVYHYLASYELQNNILKSYNNIFWKMQSSYMNRTLSTPHHTYSFCSDHTRMLCASRHVQCLCVCWCCWWQCRSGFVQHNTIYCTNVDNILEMGEHCTTCIVVWENDVYNLNNSFCTPLLEHLFIFPPISIQLPSVHKSNFILLIVCIYMEYY